MIYFEGSFQEQLNEFANYMMQVKFVSRKAEGTIVRDQIPRDGRTADLLSCASGLTAAACGGEQAWRGQREDL